MFLRNYGNAGSHYAGEQPQNSPNTASVSQYDKPARTSRCNLIALR
jgi:hypothetical protein